MKPSDIRLVLAEIGATINKHLGQHFLIDAAALSAIVAAADVQMGERILEVGPGLGVLTKKLIEAGADVSAIERDRRFAEWLPTQAWAKQLSLTNADALDVDWAKLTGAGPWKFVANLPYAITSIALRRALWSKNPPTKLVVLIQREVAERCIDKKKTSLLSLMISLASSSAQIVRRVPPGAFFPPPKVDSAVLVLEVMSNGERRERWGIDPEKVMRVAKQGFSHPRKRLASNLGLKGKEWDEARASLTLGPGVRKGGADDDHLMVAGGESVDNLHVRAEQLSVEAWVALAKSLENPAK